MNDATPDGNLPEAFFPNDLAPQRDIRRFVTNDRCLKQLKPNT